jgi:hypothetical protein
MAFGGGADYPSRRKISARLGAGCLTAAGAGQNHFRVTAGPVWKLRK